MIKTKPSDFACTHLWTSAPSADVTACLWSRCCTDTAALFKPALDFPANAGKYDALLGTGEKKHS